MNTFVCLFVRWFTFVVNRMIIPERAKAEKHNPYSTIKKGSRSLRPALLVVVVTPDGIYEGAFAWVGLFVFDLFSLTAAVVGSKDSDSVLGRITLLLSSVSSVGLSRYIAEGFYRGRRPGGLISLVQHSKLGTVVYSFSYWTFFIVRMV